VGAKEPGNCLIGLGNGKNGARSFRYSPSDSAPAKSTKNTRIAIFFGECALQVTQRSS
jgi:hypothetical protein